MVFRLAPVEIDGLPINRMVIFHGKLLNNQMVSINGIFRENVNYPTPFFNDGWLMISSSFHRDYNQK